MLYIKFQPNIVMINQRCKSQIFIYVNCSLQYAKYVCYLVRPKYLVVSGTKNKNKIKKISYLPTLFFLHMQIGNQQLILVRLSKFGVKPKTFIYFYKINPTKVLDITCHIFFLQVQLLFENFCCNHHKEVVCFL